MTADEILAKLKELAPSVAFETSRSIDATFEWDGDGPDPADDGMFPYDVLVTASTVIDGELIEGRAGLGGCYMTKEEKIDDIGGYLPQKLEEALDELADQLAGNMEPDTTLLSVKAQLRVSKAFLKNESRRRWEEEQATKSTP